MFLRIYCGFVNKYLATYLATYELFDHESGDWERKKEKKEERKIERKEAFLFQVHSTKTSFTYFKANCTCWAESLVQKGKFNILDSNLFPLSFSEKYMLIKCFTLSNVMWSVAMGDRYERLVICILHGSRTCSITMLKNFFMPINILVLLSNRYRHGSLRSGWHHVSTLLFKSVIFAF